MRAYVMKVREYLRREVATSLAKLQERITHEEEAAHILEGLNMRKANYIVELTSHWSTEGEKSTKTENNGSLEEVIQKAEKEFKKVNNRKDVQAEWSVRVRLGKVEYQLPEKYWQEYREK